jgi:hypothetical protein
VVTVGTGGATKSIEKDRTWRRKSRRQSLPARRRRYVRIITSFH